MCGLSTQVWLANIALLAGPVQIAQLVTADSYTPLPPTVCLYQVLNSHQQVLNSLTLWL